LIDNPTLVQYFGKHILAGPEEELLESLYLNLGARWITSMVKAESLVSQPLPRGTPESQALRNHVLERLTIFLAEARRKQSAYTIESLKKEGAFVVAEVRGLQVKYTLRQGRQEHAHFEVSSCSLRSPSSSIDDVDTIRYCQ
jgi:septum formation topological specificity factor MinE